MKRVYIASDPIDAELVARMLVSRRIEAIVKNEHLWPLAGLSMTVEGAPAVWGADDADADAARTLISTLKQAAPSHLPAWKCTLCREENEGPFGVCWKCGGPAPPLS